MSRSGYTCVRHLFCWINVLFWITGCGVLGIGIWLRIAYEGYASLLPQYALLSADSLAISVGAITFILSFLACCGSWFQSRCMLVTVCTDFTWDDFRLMFLKYFSLVVFMFIAEFLVGSLAFVFRVSLGHTFREELQNGLWHHYNVTANGPNSLVTIWDNIQSEFKCCGVVDYQDWFTIDAWPNRTWVPDSCCLPANSYENCGKSGDSSNFYTTGCYHQIHLWFVGRLYIVGVVGLVVAFVQFFGLISSMLLFCTVKHKRTSRTYKSYQTHA